MSTGFRRSSAVLSVLTVAMTVACAIHSSRGGEVGVYRTPDAVVADVGAAIGDANLTPVGDAHGIPAGDANGIPAGDANGDRPDALPEIRQDSGPCVGDAYTAASQPLDIYVVLDASYSSLFSTDSAVMWWIHTLDAAASASANIGMGVKFFGTDSPCDPQVYTEPDVPIAPLPDNVANLAAAIPSFPFESTPTLPALQGAILYARTWANNHRGSKVVVWLITDGIPNGCGSTVENVAQAAAEGRAGSISIPTYVIGIGNLQALDPIAKAGGTEKATIIDPANNHAAPARSVFNAMTGRSATPCE